MSKSILIDSAHSDEIRVAVIDDGKLERYDFESTSKLPTKGNIYLAKVVRVEPSLQAAFVDYGRDRHGFLSFSEIHHDYFQIPVDDAQELDEQINNALFARAEELGISVEELEQKEVGHIRYQLYRRYRIQEVIKKRQIMLVQVTKEERGHKGASLTTYISLAGRYCVLMPNTEKSSGVSRKITNHNDRMKLKKIVADLTVENGSVVLRTAGIGHSRAEIRKDFDYLCKMWDDIRKRTLESTAPCMIHEEAGIVKRAIRDMYSRDIESIYVEGREGYKVAKQFMKGLMPSHTKKVLLYDDTSEPLFKKFNVNDQIKQIYSTRVDLPSGGYLVINNTEALIAIDVNSGKGTRERNIAGTALKTNLEAAVAIARQCKLRDLAGLIVVDFIDMEDKRDNAKVERCLKAALRDDKAKIQVGTITGFGLLEFSRQRLRSSIADANMVVCPHCRGTGFVWSDESNAIQVLRNIEETCSMVNIAEVRVTLAPQVALYVMNNKRSFLSNIEESKGIKVVINMDSTITAMDFKVEPIVKRPLLEDEKDETEGEVSEDERPNVRNKKFTNKSENNKRSAKGDSKAVDIPISDGPEDNLSHYGSNQGKNEGVSRSNMEQNAEKSHIEENVSKSIKLKSRYKQRKDRILKEVAPSVPAESSEDIEIPGNQLESASLNTSNADSASSISVGNEKKSRSKRRKRFVDRSVTKTEDNSSDKEGEVFKTSARSALDSVSLEGKSYSVSVKVPDGESRNVDRVEQMDAVSNGIVAGEDDSSLDIGIAKQSLKKKTGWWQKLLKKPGEE